ncbi:adhesion G-protein coupled receptor G2 isoform X2 [Carassius carassius]|uniref:adhesion G-protein coupled receptor G2 isoform X2 n=1 Tax=Carassius carassius TaxID=217509 RepID=UPI0028697A55|nr:adhesion G-protein coupled receptor G2 isoform X2 [Carassius carassius]
MQWNICGLLLILSVPFCISVGPFKSCTKTYNNLCPITGRASDRIMDMFILGRDGFMGYLKTGNNFARNMSGILSCSNGSSVNTTQQLLNLTVFSFEENTTFTNSISPTYSKDYGVILSRYLPYKLNISRYVIPTFVCLIEGKCKNGTLTDWITDLKWTNETTKYFEKVAINAGEESKMNNIEIQNGKATCFKCGSPFEVVKQVSLPKEMSNKFIANKTETDAGTAAEAMKNLSSILSLMENLTVASISMGNVKGILKKISTESEIKMSYFIYSSETDVKVLDDLDQLKNYPNVFSIPEEAAKKALNQSRGKAFMGVFRFPSMTKDAENSPVLNDEVYAIEMGAQIYNLSDNISLTFPKNQAIGTPVCKSWDGNGSKPNWTTEGCSTLTEGEHITCKCEHLTFFAVLMIPPEPISQNDLNALTYITYIGCGLSLFFLSIGLFMHFLMRKVKTTDSMHVLINLFVALFLLNVAFLSNEYVARAEDITACKVMAGFMHYCLLSSFTWFAVEAFHLCLQMAKHSVTIKHYIIKISVVGWAPPALVVSIIYVLGKYGEQTIKTDTSNVTMCWILDSDIHYYVNISYYCFIFVFTFTTFIVVLRWLSLLKLSRLNKVEKVQRSSTTTSDITTILGLCCMLGLTWSFAFFGYGALRLPSYYIFTILNSFQGFFLFIYYLKASRHFGDSAASEESKRTEDTNTENPYDDLSTEDTRKAI